jgi:hypothetical protein
LAREGNRDGPQCRSLHAVEARGVDVTIPLVEDNDALEEGFKPQFAK